MLAQYTQFASNIACFTERLLVHEYNFSTAIFHYAVDHDMRGLLALTVVAIEFFFFESIILNL